MNICDADINIGDEFTINLVEECYCYDCEDYTVKPKKVDARFLGITQDGSYSFKILGKLYCSKGHIIKTYDCMCGDGGLFANVAQKVVALY